MELANVLHRGRGQGLTRKQLGYVLIIPALVVIVCISVFPFITTVHYSLHTIKLNVPHLGRPYVGFENYIRLLNSSRFIYDFKITLFFASAVVVAQLLFGLAIALVINKEFKGRGIVRATVLAPWAIALVIVAQFWKWMYNAVFGVANALFLLLGVIDKPVDWLGASASLAISSVIVAELWRNTPFMAIVILAGLQSIPGELYEAAKIDGAGALQRFRYVTFPMLSKLIAITVMFSTIVTFANFDIVWILTHGGPRYTTHMFGTYAFNIGIETGHLPRGAAIALFMFPVLGVAAFFILRNIARGEE